ncbi:MAG: sugar phosphate isomerase/epimerase family protein [Thermoleophilia bacterium]
MSWKACVATSAGPTGFGPMLYAGRVGECVAVSRELGFEGIEISMRSPAELDRRELETLLRDAHLELAALASGRVFLEDGLSLTDSDESRRARAVSRVKELLDYGALFGAPVIVGLARGGGPPDGDLDSAVGRFVASMRECADYAAGLGVGLVVEAINRYETALLNTAAQTVAALEQVGRPNVAVLLDVFHMNIEEVSIGDAIRATGARLGHFHLVDSNRRAAGMGHIDFDEVAAALADIGYDGWLSAEVLPLPDDRAAAEQARRYAAAINQSVISRHI